MPRHVAIIMDGNGRWATKRFLPRVAGHVKGADAVRGVVETCLERGVEYLTLFAFSSENWRRPEEEVSMLMRLFVTMLEREVVKMHANDIRLKVVGDLSRFNVAVFSCANKPFGWFNAYAHAAARGHSANDDPAADACAQSDQKARLAALERAVDMLRRQGAHGVVFHWQRTLKLLIDQSAQGSGYPSQLAGGHIALAVHGTGAGNTHRGPRKALERDGDHAVDGLRHLKRIAGRLPLVAVYDIDAVLHTAQFYGCTANVNPNSVHVSPRYFH